MQAEVKEQFSDFLTHQRALDSKTICSYFVELDRLEEIIGKPLSQIQNYREASQLIIECKKRGHNGRPHKDPTTAKIASHLHCFFDFCVKHDYMKAPHPFWGGHGFKKGKSPEPEFFDANDADDRSIILRVLFCPDLSITHRAMIWTVYATGIRRGELVGLNFEDLNIVERTINIRRSIAKMDSNRRVPFDVETAERLKDHKAALLSRWPDQIAASGFPLFPTHTGGRMEARSFWRLLDRLAARLGLGVKINPHKWRHSWPVRMLLANVDLTVISKCMGHQRITTTMLYTHYRPKTLRDAIDKAPALMA